MDRVVEVPLIVERVVEKAEKHTSSSKDSGQQGEIRHRAEGEKNSQANIVENVQESE